MTYKNDGFHKITIHDWKKLFFELFVVFLGVTAGFLLNNWQLSRQDKQLEKEYLNGFIHDADENIDELQSMVKKDSIWMESMRPKLLDIKEKKLPIDSANEVVRKISLISKADIQKGTYEDITNSGHLNIIDDYNIKKEIVDYNIAISGVRFMDNYFYTYFNNFVMPFIFTNYNVIEGRITNSEVIRSTQFSNIVTGYFGMVQQREAIYKRLLSKSITLRNKISKLL